MAQYARPDADQATGDWVETPLWSKIDEGTPGDDVVITSDDNTSPDNADVRLSDVTDPTTDTGHIIRARWNKSAAGGHTINAVCELWEGIPDTGTLRATLTVNDISETEAENTYTLNSSEANSITDYTDLYLRISRQGDTGGAPSGRRSLVVEFAEFEVPDANTDRAAQVSWAEFEVPPGARGAQVSWAEFEVPTAPRQAQVSWAELEVPPGARAAYVSWAELEVPDAPRAAYVSWAELEVPENTRAAYVSWAELEVPTAPRQAWVSWAELEIPDASRQAQISWAELEVPPGARQGQVSWAEFEVSDVDRAVQVSWAEFEVPDVSESEIYWWLFRKDLW